MAFITISGTSSRFRETAELSRRLESRNTSELKIRQGKKPIPQYLLSIRRKFGNARSCRGPGISNWDSFWWVDQEQDDSCAVWRIDRCTQREQEDDLHLDRQ